MEINENRECTVCDSPGKFESSQDRQLIRSNVREFQNQEFTVWRCVNCGSLHSLEPIDFDNYYRNYPVQKQKKDFFTRIMFQSRLKILNNVGLTKAHSILDFGCGNGSFVQFMIEKGYSKAVGFDPYSKNYADPEVLNTQYDFVISQDVIEHAIDVNSELEKLGRITKPDGFMVIGTPDATDIDLNDPLDQVGQLHQPYHRHILARTQLVRLIERVGFVCVLVLSRWYVDTWVPFGNSAFITRFWQATGGVMDASFEDPPSGLLLKNPSLIFWGLFGRILMKPKDVVIVARKTELPTADT